jgi:hypothetical protein
MFENANNDLQERIEKTSLEFQDKNSKISILE